MYLPSKQQQTKIQSDHHWPSLQSCTQNVLPIDNVLRVLLSAGVKFIVILKCFAACFTNWLLEWDLSHYTATYNQRREHWKNPLKIKPNNIFLLHLVKFLFDIWIYRIPLRGRSLSTKKDVDVFRELLISSHLTWDAFLNNGIIWHHPAKNLVFKLFLRRILFNCWNCLLSNIQNQELRTGFKTKQFLLRNTLGYGYSYYDMMKLHTIVCSYQWKLSLSVLCIVSLNWAGLEKPGPFIMFNGVNIT